MTHPQSLQAIYDCDISRAYHCSTSLHACRFHSFRNGVALHRPCSQSVVTSQNAASSEGTQATERSHLLCRGMSVAATSTLALWAEGGPVMELAPLSLDDKRGGVSGWITSAKPAAKGPARHSCGLHHNQALAQDCVDRMQQAWLDVKDMHKVERGSCISPVSQPREGCVAGMPSLLP